MKYEIKTTHTSDGHSFDTLTVTEGKAWILYIANGMGISKEFLNTGDSWVEGVCEELYGVYETEEEADRASDGWPMQQ